MKQTILKLLLFINSILLIAYMGLTAHADFHLNTRGVIPLFLSSLLLIDVTYVSSCNISIQDSPYAEHSERKPYSVYSYVYRYSAYIYNLYDILLYDCPYLL